ncbi:hypothetical protein EMIHUDRAFT_247906 [Emiliania huxleyi CCMP1516]|uniref:Secreted protein n=2 Tax=Emiliania huxleyi TaxID=2903 RepID=A0A0D3IJP6_EMIH1|nr:hypothetical protein EMIHUDRAFT_247906 [Emiliania huxleyi CCMP1516]EOD11481.1 hypothetical protein EMIHUDRAFT_247906 [Emiliania huxleyi CCMP1516]|eukprot:XP_005763910.1 hypothetical protein EMIHUDRAFT_247906 [Emiliania huxleyi CCMP1516]
MEDMDPPDPSVQVVRSLLACAGCFVPSSAFATSTADWQPEPQPAGQGSAGATAPPGPRSGATAPATADLPLRRAPEARGGACTLATHLAAWRPDPSLTAPESEARALRGHPTDSDSDPRA